MVLDTGRLGDHACCNFPWNLLCFPASSGIYPSTHCTPLNGCFVAIKTKSIIHQIPQPPRVINFNIPKPIWPMMNRSIPNCPNKMDIIRASIQFTFFPPVAGATLFAIVVFLRNYLQLFGRVLGFIKLTLFEGFYRGYNLLGEANGCRS